MEQQIQFCTTSDGVHLAFSTLGQGPPMIWPPYWVTHLEEEWEFPLVKAFFLNLAYKYTIIRYDKHGCGLSDRDRTDFSLEKEVQDLESIIDHLNLDKFSLFGMSQAGPTAIAYTAKHPESVSHLILFGTWPQGNVGAPPEVKAALCNLIRTSWGLGSKMLADIFVPDSGKEVLDSFKKWQRKAATGEMAARLLETEEQINVTELLPEIKTPTLVLHRKGDRACSVQGGKDLAKLIPNARLILLEGIDHLPWAGDSKSVSNAILEFLGNQGVSGSEPSIEGPIEKKEFKRKLAAILCADVKGYSRLMNDDEIYTIETLKKYRQIMSDLITQHSGRVVDSPGDNLLAEFSSAVDAVEGAVDIQKRLKKENEQLFEAKQLEFRVGVNIGDVVKDGDRIYGNGVNVAARIEGLTDPGGICISRNAYDHVKDKLDLGFEYLGKHAVKNIKEPVEVYKVLLDSDSPRPLVEKSLELPD